MGLQQCVSIARRTHLNLSARVELYLVRQIPKRGIAQDLCPTDCQRFGCRNVAHDCTQAPKSMKDSIRLEKAKAGTGIYRATSAWDLDSWRTPQLDVVHGANNWGRHESEPGGSHDDSLAAPLAHEMSSTGEKDPKLT